MEERKIILSNLIEDLRKELSFTVVAGMERTSEKITDSSIRRPGLALAGFIEHFGAGSLQVLGQTESAYLATLNPKVRVDHWMKYLNLRPPGIIVSRGIDLPPGFLDCAEEVGICIISSPMITENLVRKIDVYLERTLAPTITVHGVLVDVFGIGTLILGESGVGKSESALELLERGHRLISDDVVQVRRIRYERLIGASPELTRHHMEIRGLGILNIRHLYGAAAVLDEAAIDLVAILETWKEGHPYDRLGLEEEKHEVLGLEVPKILIPVQPGRNIAVIIEVGAMNQRLKNMGVYGAAEFSDRLDHRLDGSVFRRRGVR